MKEKGRRKGRKEKEEEGGRKRSIDGGKVQGVKWEVSRCR